MQLKPISSNTLFYGDNLEILQGQFPSEVVDLVYLDPPFNSNRNYNVLYKNEKGKESDAQIVAFEDTWHWNLKTELAYTELIRKAPPGVSTLISSLRQFIGENQMMAYLVMMTARLVELHRVLKLTGSLWLHCDPTASHYLKIILDTIFGPDQFRAEVIWKRNSAHNSAKRPGPVHDTLLFYSKTNNYTWNQQYQPYDQSYIDQFYRHTDAAGRKFRLSDLTGAGTRNGETGLSWRGINPTEKGRHWSVPPSELDKLDETGRIYWPSKGTVPAYKRYLDEMSGVPMQDVWADIDPLGAQAAERLGYPTQKPSILLERIICASSNPGEVVLDPFCGCGTAISAAQKLGRRWLGIDITYLAINLQINRLKAEFNLELGKDYADFGLPKDVDSALNLARRDRFQFQCWALSLIQAKTTSGAEVTVKQGKKGADRGIDGEINFIDDNSYNQKRVIVQVKSGHVKSGDIRDLRGVLEREREQDAVMAVFLTLEEPSNEMLLEANKAGCYLSPGWNRQYPRIQILTIEALLNDRRARIEMPPEWGTFKQAKRVKGGAIQGELAL